jgi:hypothetical protein
MAEGAALAPASAFEDVAVALVATSIGHEGASIAQRACDEMGIAFLCQKRAVLRKADQLLIKRAGNMVLEDKPVQNVEQGQSAQARGHI